MDKAIILTNGRLDTEDAKTAHGLIRGTSRFKIDAVIDPINAGRDAGEILDGQFEPLPVESDGSEYGFGYQCRWNVAGTVEHWGHIHQRTNQYEASFRVEMVDNAWKVTNMELLNEQRLQFETKLRGL